MKHYDYVTRKEAKPYRDEFEAIMKELQNAIRDKFTFQFKFIGSSARNMITFDATTNVGFDFDINIEINDPDNNYSAKEIRDIIRNALNNIVYRHGFKNCEDGTRVLTIKKVISFQSRIEYSCDIAIVNNYYDDNDIPCQEYIRFNKNQLSYTWEKQTAPYELEEMIKEIKEHKMWNDVFDLYLDKKNNNIDPHKKSRALYAETIKEIYDQI